MNGEPNILPPAQRRLVTAVVMIAMMMVVLDTTIANVALPHMQASLGATPETVSWVLTSYIVATAIAMPVTGWLSDRFGRRVLFTVAVAGFTVSSALCGMAGSLEMMVAARIAQGVFGAFIAPMSQAIMYDINPPHRHAHAMMIWGLGVLLAPIMGPVLGGVLTENFTWRWVFFINVPIGIATTVASWLLLAGQRAARRPFDISGFAMLAVALGAFQLMLDRGPQLDWFEANEIIVEGAVAIAAFWMFCIHSATAKAPLLPLAMFADRNFSTALILCFVFGGVMLVGSALLAPFMQTLLGYPVYDAGLMMVPRGAGTMIAMVAASRLASRIDARFLIGAGLVLIALSLRMMTGFAIGMDSRPLITSGFLQGLGLGFVLMPLNLLAFGTLAPHLRTEGAALYNLVRNIGGSLGISVAMATLARNVQTSHADMASTLTRDAVPIDVAVLAGGGGLATLPVNMVDAEVNRQALMVAYIDDFWAMMWVSVLVIPLVLILRPAKPGHEGPPMLE